MRKSSTLKMVAFYAATLITFVFELPNSDSDVIHTYNYINLDHVLRNGVFISFYQENDFKMEEYDIHHNIR